MRVLKELMEKLKSMAAPELTFDPAVLDDPIALQTDWAPAKGGGTNFRTHYLKLVDSDRMEFQASWTAVLFGLVFLLSGLGFLAGFTVNTLSESEIIWGPEHLFVPLMCLVFAGVGGSILYFFTAPIVFDKRVGAFWKGRTAPDQTINVQTLDQYAHLKDIHALQVIAEHVRGSKTSFFSYELNAVLKDGRRINVIDHGDKARMLADAHSLAEFLQRPVWNAIARDADH